MIMNEDYKYALVALTFSAFCVLMGFIALFIADDNKILDLSNPSLRNPRKSSSDKRVKYISGLTPDIMGGKNKSGKKNKSSKKDLYMQEVNDNDFYESVGNMRVYKRGEKIDYHDSDDE